MNPAKPTALPADLSALDGFPVSLIIKLLPAEMVEAAIPIVLEKLKLTPEKLALILIRRINPDENMGQREEARLRGVRPETLKSMKDRGDLRRAING